MTTSLTFVHALSPLHAGTGQGIDIIDLPIARERATALPFLPGSSLKGVLRDAGKNSDLTRAIFGPDTANASEQAGAIVLTDQRLLLLPVRSLLGTFAWVTSPYILQRLKRDAVDANYMETPAIPPTNATTDHQSAYTSAGTALVSTKQQIYLEDLDLENTTDPRVTEWSTWIGQQIFVGDAAWQQELSKRLCVVHDDVFSFLSQHATEINARVRIDTNTHTVTKGGLWYEESLPAESVLTGLLLLQPNGKTQSSPEQMLTHLRSLVEKPLQLGGKATIGRGLCRVSILGGAV
ncbi:MAG: type III-B CRISPR module RAMP protein Cmr4 [Roseiflexaceae bacterium]|nr:type III-B CRISPR module RAMP protein Cmr4 [Roseiflexaceae bacterium]